MITMIGAIPSLPSLVNSIPHRSLQYQIRNALSFNSLYIDVKNCKYIHLLGVMHDIT